MDNFEKVQHVPRSSISVCSPDGPVFHPTQLKATL